MSIREKLLADFEAHPGQVISGESLAKRSKVSRVAVWKQIQSLKALGLPLESAGRSGYRLLVPADTSLVKLTKKSQDWVTPHYFFNTHSTQSLAKEGGQSGLSTGHLWVTETQSKGHGRLGRLWESGYGGLWFSLLLRPNLPAGRVPPLTLLAGLALSKAVEKVTAVKAKLKWPNDLMIGRKKLAGILTEISGQMDRTDWVVIGIGLNVNNRISKPLSGIATSLIKETGKSSKRAVLLRAFLEEFKPMYQRFQKQGFGPFQVSYWHRYSRPGEAVRIKTSNETIAGVARGVDASGAIMVESRRKIEAIREGEIIL